MKLLFIILGFILFTHFIQRLFRETAAQDEYVAKQEEIEKFLQEASTAGKEDMPEFPSEMPPPRMEETRVPPPREQEEPVCSLVAKPEPGAPCHSTAEEVTWKPEIILTREGLRNAILYQAILGPPRAEKEWEWTGLK